MSIGDNIKAKRIERGLTQTELGKRMGITRSTVCKVEKGLEANLTMERIKNFALALNCFPSELIDNLKVNVDTVVVTDKLADEKQILLEYYSSLDTGQRERVLEYARLLSGDKK